MNKAVAALISLHETEIRNFYQVWKKAVNSNIQLPDTEDPDYKSHFTLLYHVFRSSKGYLTWICRNLEIPVPLMREIPDPENFDTTAQEYIEHLIQVWRNPLKDITEADLDKVFKNNRGVDYSIEAMLEHAVMHLVRHRYQLETLIQSIPE